MMCNMKKYWGGGVITLVSGSEEKDHIFVLIFFFISLLGREYNAQMVVLFGVSCQNSGEQLFLINFFH